MRGTGKGATRRGAESALLLLALLIGTAAASGADPAWRKRGTAAGLTVAMNPLNPSVLYAEGAGGALIVSHDRGATWNPWSSPGLIAIRQVYVHPADTAVVLCAAGSGGLRRSSDHGLTWSTVVSGFGIDGESIAPYPGDPDTLYAGNFEDGGVHRSTDRGATWSFRGISANRLCALAVRPDDPSVLCAGTGGGTISRSTDGGITWSIVKAGTAGSNFQEVPFITFHPVVPSVAYATTYGSIDSTLDVWKSTDGGATWARTALRKTGTWALAVDPLDPDLLYAGSFTGALSAVHRSTDGGITWTPLGAGLPGGSYMWSLKVHPLEPAFVALAATSGFFGELGIFRLLEPSAVLTGALLDATGGDTVRNGSVRNAATGDVSAIAAGDPVWSLGWYEGDSTLTPTLVASAFPYVTNAAAVTFTPGPPVTADIPMTPLARHSVTGTVSDSLTGQPVSAEVVLTAARSIGDTAFSATTDSAGAFRFDSLYAAETGVNAYTSIAFNPEIPFAGALLGPLDLTADTILSVALTKADVFVVSAFDSGAYLPYYQAALGASGMRSAVWNVAGKGPAPAGRTAEFSRKILVYYTGALADSAPAAHLDSLEALLASGSRLLLMGQNLVEYSAAHPLFSARLGVGFAANTPLAYNRSVAGEVLAGFEFFTTGPGIVAQTSRDVLSILDPATRAILDYGANTGGTAAARRGSSADSARAVVVGFGLEGVYTAQKRAEFMKRLVDYLDGTIVTAVEGEGGGTTPSAFRLLGNYPNPFNPSTTIVFEAPSRTEARVGVYDVLGRFVGTVWEGIAGPGRNSATWDAAGLAAGVYIVRVSAPGVALTGKMLLVR